MLEVRDETSNETSTDGQLYFFIGRLDFFLLCVWYVLVLTSVIAEEMEFESLSPEVGPAFGDTLVEVSGTKFIDGPALRCQFANQQVVIVAAIAASDEGNFRFQRPWKLKRLSHVLAPPIIPLLLWMSVFLLNQSKWDTPCHLMERMIS